MIRGGVNMFVDMDSAIMPLLMMINHNFSLPSAV
jgi:hypothetical protein